MRLLALLLLTTETMAMAEEKFLTEEALVLSLQPTHRRRNHSGPRGEFFRREKYASG
jgi:hypothetical protein